MNSRSSNPQHCIIHALAVREIDIALVKICVNNQNYANYVKSNFNSLDELKYRRIIIQIDAQIIIGLVEKDFHTEN